MLTRTLLATVVLAAVNAVSLMSAQDSARTPHAVIGQAVDGPSRPLDVSDTAVARTWGIRIESLRATAGGYMLDLRYRVVDARKAKPLFERKTKPTLRDEASGAQLSVPVPPKTGALRSSNEPKAGRTYFMFFGNPARFIKPGSRVTLTIGDFSVAGIPVSGDDLPAASADEHANHAPAPASRRDASTVQTVEVSPMTGITLVDSAAGETTLAAVVDTDGPVLLNFIFTSCTTVCPVMSAGFARLHQTLGDARPGVRLVSISIDPDVDTPATLRLYAARYAADHAWRFLTGSRANVEAAQRAFGAYRGDKNNHAPATYFRRERHAPWQVVSGLSSVTALRSLVLGPA